MLPWTIMRTIEGKAPLNLGVSVHRLSPNEWVIGKNMKPAESRAIVDKKPANTFPMHSEMSPVARTSSCVVDRTRA
jgi:hypothetical protein